MIIVSQDNTSIANFDNIVQIYITSAEDEDIWEIRYEGVNSLYETLGEYKTEERAKEVLQEIIKVYKFYNGKTYLVEDSNNLIGKYQYGVYEMPVEKVDDK